MTNSKILLISSFGRSLINFRGDLIKHLINLNFEVLCAAPDFDENTINQLSLIGAKTVSYNLERKGLNPIKDNNSINELKAIIKRNNIDLVFPYTIKPVIYSSIAARKCNVPTMSLITGLGFTFSGITLKSKILQTITSRLYRYALKSNSLVIFQNNDDLQLFIDEKITQKRQSLHVVNGSGINLSRFKYRNNEKSKGDSIKFITSGRLSIEKGVQFFIDASIILKSKYPNSEFHLIGESPEGATGIPKALLNKLHSEKIIVHHGYTSNVVPLLSSADIFVLASFYREGVPRSILEALSIGMPIITTKMPGCKETVTKKNGFLIEPKKLEPLIKSMEYFINNPDAISEMGKESRKLAENKFDVKIINSNIIDLIKKIPTNDI